MNTKISPKWIIIAAIITLSILVFVNNCTIRIHIDQGIENRTSERREIKKNIDLLPDVYKKKLKKEGWTIKIVGFNLDDFYKQGEGIIDYAALTDIRNREILIEYGEEDQILHELCHACLVNVETKSCFFIKYTGIEEEQKLAFPNDSYFRENYDEYIVEQMKNYLTDPESLSNYPITRKAVIEMLNDYDWLKDAGKNFG